MIKQDKRSKQPARLRELEFVPFNPFNSEVAHVPKVQRKVFFRKWTKYEAKYEVNAFTCPTIFGTRVTNCLCDQHAIPFANQMKESILFRKTAGDS